MYIYMIHTCIYMYIYTFYIHNIYIYYVYIIYVYIYTSIYIIESVCLFVCLFAVNAKTTARIDAKRSGITMNDPESVLCVLKSPVLVFLGRYRDISGFRSRPTAILTYLTSTSGSCVDA